MNPGTEERIAALAQRRRTLLDELQHEPGGLSWSDRLTSVADQVLEAVYEDVVERLGTRPNIAIVATGGYGRRELAPASDVDVTLVPLDDAAAELDRVVKELFQAMLKAFATLETRVGYAYRLISDAPGLDAKTRTGLLDARLVAGSHEPFEALMAEYWRDFPVAEFLIEKINERRAMAAKFNDSPLAVEPNLKEGAGGLRSFHAANWIGVAIGARMRNPGRDVDFLLRVRNQLHMLAGRQLDTLTRERRQQIGELWSIDPLDLGSELAEHMVGLQKMYERALEELNEGRFPLTPTVSALRGEARVSADADAGQAALGIAFATRLGLTVADLKVSTSKQTGPEALLAVGSGSATLRNLERCGLLEALIPELERCRTLMPGDASHAYTVYEHTMRVIEHLDRIDEHPFLGELKAQLRDLSPLYLAALLHDVGKIDPERDHSEYGAEIARRTAKRWRLPGDLADLVAWLVREHLTLDRFIKFRDVEQPDTALELAKIVGDRERLAMLAILTYCDVNAVAPGLWTQVQESFSRELVLRTEAALEAESPAPPDPILHQRRLLRQLKREEVPDEELAEFVESMPAHYLLRVGPEEVREHFGYFRKALQGEVTVQIVDRLELMATEVLVCGPDRPGVLSEMLGVFYALDLSIESIRASTSDSAPAVILDSFTVTFGRRPVPPATASQLEVALSQVAAGAKSAEDVLRQRGKDPGRKQEIFTHTYIEGEPGILEIRAPRGRGMAFRIAKTLATQQWDILAARVGQWAGNGSASFYVLGPGGTRLTAAEVDEALNPQKRRKARA